MGVGGGLPPYCLGFLGNITLSGGLSCALSFRNLPGFQCQAFSIEGWWSSRSRNRQDRRLRNMRYFGDELKDWQKGCAWLCYFVPGQIARRRACSSFLERMCSHRKYGLSTVMMGCAFSAWCAGWQRVAVNAVKDSAGGESLQCRRKEKPHTRDTKTEIQQASVKHGRGCEYQNSV